MLHSSVPCKGYMCLRIWLKWGILEGSIITHNYLSGFGSRLLCDQVANDSFSCVSSLVLWSSLFCFHHSFSIFTHRMWTACRCIWRRFVFLTCSATVKRRVAGFVSCAVTQRKPQVNNTCLFKHMHIINDSLSNLRQQYHGYNVAETITS